MSVTNIGKGKWKIICTQKRKPRKRELTLKGVTKLEAQEAEIQLKKDMKAEAAILQDGSLTSSKKIYETFDEALDAYVDKGKVWKVAYVERLREHLGHSRLIGNIHEIGIWDDLLIFKDFMLNDATKPDGSTYSPATVNNHINIAKAIITHAFTDLHRIGANFLAGFPTIPVQNNRKKILSNDERERLFSNLPDYLKPLVYMSMRVPTRISELINLTVDHVDYDKLLFQLQDTETKNGEGRWLPIFDEMADYIRSIPKEQVYIFSKVPGEPKPLGFFSSKEKKYLFSEYEAWNKALRLAGIEGYNYHKTRQQSACQFLADGFTESETMKIGGWKSYAAFSRYITLTEDRLLKKMGRVVEDQSWKQRLAPKALAF